MQFIRYEKVQNKPCEQPAARIKGHNRIQIMEQCPDETVMLLITNAKAYTVPFHLEPWREYHEMESGQRFTVVIEGSPNPPEIVCTETDIFFWAGADTPVRLYGGNTELRPGPHIRGRTQTCPQVLYVAFQDSPNDG